MNLPAMPVQGLRFRILAVLSRWFSVLLFGGLGQWSSSMAAEPGFSLPPDFVIQRVAGEPEIQFPMFACLDERGRLFVAESSGLDLYEELQKLTRKCRISVLEDRDDDGRFERAGVFADQLVFPMGLVWRDGKLYAADPPDLVTLEDIDGDGRADKRTAILSGFGHTDNGSLHGLTFGPDGWLYLTMGQPDGYKLKRADGSFLEGKSGSLLRSRPDGSEVEVVCRGFENLVEIEFLPAGEIIGTDNWFLWPTDGQRDALVHLVEGGLYPLKLRDEGTSFLVSGEPLPPLAIYPAVALSGIVRYRGAAFPTRWHDVLFTAQFNTRKVSAHRLARHGSTFRAQDEDFLTTDDPDFHPSDVLEDVDGSLLVVDTGAWYVHHCPTGRIRKAPARGAIYRVRFIDAGAIVKSRRNQLEEGRTARAKNPSHQSPMDPNALTSVVADTDAVARAAREAGRAKDRTAEMALTDLLTRPEPQVRLAAAEALAHCGSSNTIPALLAALTGDADQFLEHALIHALHRLAGAPALVAALDHSHPRVQRAALTLLDQPPHRTLTSEAVLQRLSADDESLRRTARKIFQQHADWADQAAPVVRELIVKRALTAPESDALRELILAFQANSAVQSLVATAATNSGLPPGRRVFVLETMAQTKVTPFPDAWVGSLAHSLRDSGSAVRLQAARTAGTRRIAALHETLVELIGQTNLAPELRLEALRATLRRRPKLTSSAFELLLTQVGTNAGPGARLAAAELLGRARWANPENDPARLVAMVSGDRLISPSTLLPLLVRSEGEGFHAAWNFVMQAIKDGWQPSQEELQTIRGRMPPGKQTELENVARELAQRAASQREQIDSYAQLLTGGNAEHGWKWFSEKAGCLACHRVSGQGGVLGPDLTKIGAIRSGRDLIESIVLPSATFAQGYETFSVTLRDGDELTGTRVRQPDEAFVLRDAGGAEHRFNADQVQATRRQAVSLMPEGLLSALTRGEVRDLLAYLQSLK